ncbi:MAG TPA: ankyrin repeat domain-containing protein, partial [Gammaproteobacteria bacterium]|nr:ankyrin repeat domain-containing protein [Gammaproteobacteria bacterium]
EEKDFLSTEDYFIHLVRCPHDLYIALRKKPILIQEKDSKDQTLLHHAARVGHDMDSMGASLILFLLLSSPNLDFNIKDKNGNTPLHIAALNSNEPITCKYIFPNFLRTAFIAEFDFDTLNNQGQTILHIAARTTFENINNVEQVLNCVPNIPLNTLSTSGSTALYYALNHLRLKEAHTLLEHNANPKIFGKDSEGQERNPWDMVNQHIEMICEKLAPLESTTSPTKDDTDTNFFDRIEMIHLNETKKELLLLKKMIENSSHAKTCTEIWIKWMTSFFSKKEKEFPPTKQNSHHLGY